MPDALALAKVAEWKRTARKIAGVSDETLLGCAKQFYGMREVLKAHGAVAISIDCLGGCYTGKLQAYPCLGFMELQDIGLFGTCENDIRSTVAMVVFHAMTKGRMGYISDPAIDSSRRAMIFAHCVSTRKLLGVASAREEDRLPRGLRVVGTVASGTGKRGRTTSSPGARLEASEQISWLCGARVWCKLFTVGRRIVLTSV